MKYSDFYNTVTDMGYHKSKFTNKHGEEYVVIRTKSLPQMYFIAGHETDWEMQPLFHPKFDVWSAEEIVKLGQALSNLGGKK